jgi:hypothetical protein
MENYEDKFVFMAKYKNEIHDVSEIFEHDNELIYILLVLKDDERFNFGENVNLVLVKYPEPNNEEKLEVIQLTKENQEDPLSKYADLKEKDGKKFYYLYLEIRTYEKFRLRVFYYGPKDDRQTLETIKRRCEEFIDEKSRDFVEFNDDDYKLFDSETNIDDIKKNDHIVVITTGRFITHVLENIGTKANSVLILTSKSFENQFRQQFKTQKYKQVKEVYIDVEKLLTNVCLFPELNRYLIWILFSLI